MSHGRDNIMYVFFFQIVSFLMGIIYFGQEYNKEGVQNINGALFLLLTNMTFQNVFAVINVSRCFNFDLAIHKVCRRGGELF